MKYFITLILIILTNVSISQEFYVPLTESFGGARKNEVVEVHINEYDRYTSTIQEIEISGDGTITNKNNDNISETTGSKTNYLLLKSSNYIIFDYIDLFCLENIEINFQINNKSNNITLPYLKVEYSITGSNNWIEIQPSYNDNLYWSSVFIKNKIPIIDDYISIRFSNISNGNISIKIDDISVIGYIRQECMPLPITLIYFEGETHPNFTYLYWKTASEFNFSHFEVQRSIDGKSFETIEYIGSNNEPKFYKFYDYNRPKSKTIYYRLKQIDLDGYSEFSKIISVSFSDDIKYINYYNILGQKILKPSGIYIKEEIYINDNNKIKLMIE